MRITVIAYALVFSYANLGTVLAQNQLVDICHYQENNDNWKLISVQHSAIDVHLEHHDDALPGETTSITGTMLDAECEVTCPCKGLTLHGVTWGDSFETEVCSSFNGEIGSLDSSDLSRLALSSSQMFCVIITREPGDLLLEFTNMDELAACEESLRQIAFNDGVPCQ